jgi:hypothetical protein
MKIESPRLTGVKEHFARALLYRRLAKGLPSDDAYRLEIAAIYSCRALADIMITAAEKQEVRGFKHSNEQQSKADFRAYIAPKFAFYELVSRIRIHDFHRFGIRPPTAEASEAFYAGPTKLIAPPGATVVLALTPNGPKVEASGGGGVKFDRNLDQRDGKFFDDISGQYVSLEQVLDAFLSSAEVVIAEFETMLPPPLRLPPLGS